VMSLDFLGDIGPSDHSVVLGLTQPPVKMSIRNIPVGKGGRCVRLTTSPPSRAECHEIREPETRGTLWATPGLLRDCFNFMSYEDYKVNKSYMEESRINKKCA
jgi:hypothetical protein